MVLVLSAAARRALIQPSYRPPTTLFSLLSLTPARHASILNELSDVKASYKKRHRLGRGPSSGRGKTSTRGHKGQKQHGKVPAGFNGGQTPLEVAQGEHGFKNNFSKDMAVLNLKRVQQWIEKGRLDPSQPITLKELLESRCIHQLKDGVKLLGDGASNLTHPINITVSEASGSAITRVESLGGKIKTRYYTPKSMWQVLNGLSHPTERIADGFKYKLPDPTSRKDLEYYMDKKNRGYLSHLVKDGQGSSLFWKRPLDDFGVGTEGGVETEEILARKKQGENQLW